MPMWLMIVMGAGAGLVLLALLRFIRERLLMRRASKRLWQNACAQYCAYLDEGYSRDEVAIVSEHGVPVVRVR